MVDATEIFHDLCWLLECEIATLEGLKDVKRTAKHELKRHQSIVDQTIAKVWAYCRDYGFGIAPKNGRVQDALLSMNNKEGL